MLFRPVNFLFLMLYQVDKSREIRLINRRVKSVKVMDEVNETEDSVSECMCTSNHSVTKSINFK